MKLLPPALNTAPYPMAQSVLDGPALQAWTQGVAQEDALHETANLKNNYLTVVFHNWYVDYAAGRINGGDPDAPPPYAPNGLMVQVADDGITCDLVPLGPPVCEVPVYTKLPAPKTQAENAATFGALNPLPGALPSPFNAAVALFVQPVTAPDGSKWVRVA